eukprot:COSAG02_NODE_1016_length_15190_cov_128.667418_5_plen_65_part_00
MELFEADDACMFEGGADSADTDPSCGICLECVARRQRRDSSGPRAPTRSHGVVLKGDLFSWNAL